MANVTTFSDDISQNECVPTNGSWDTNQTRPGQAGTDIGSLTRWFYLAVLVIGVLANLAFLVVVFRHKSMRTITNIYLANLAVADISFLALNIIRLFILPIIPLITALQCIFQVINVIMYYSSMLLLTLVTLERFQAVCQPLKHRSTATKQRAIKQVVAVWSCSFVFSVAVNIDRFLSGGCTPVGKGSKNVAGGSCGNSVQSVGAQGFAPSPSDMFKSIPFILTLSLNFGLYIGIIRSLRNRSRSFTERSPTWVKSAHNSLIRTTRMVAVNTFVFFLCNASFPMLLIRLSITGTHADQDGIAGVVFSTLVLLNSCVNPFIYNLTNVKYRKAFLDVFVPFRRTAPSRPAANKPTVFHIESAQTKNTEIAPSHNPVK